MAISNSIDNFGNGNNNAQAKNILTLSQYEEQLAKERDRREFERKTRYLRQRYDMELRLGIKNQESISKIQKALDKQNAKKAEAQRRKERAEERKEQLANYSTQRKALEKAIKGTDKKDKSALDELNKALKTLDDQYLQNRKEESKEAKERWAAELKERYKLSNILSDLSTKLTTYIQQTASYQAKINTRLYGSNTNWDNIQSRLMTVSGMSPYVSTSKLMENTWNLVNSGIAYNLEQRAFLETISENIASTFDAANSALLRIVRVQQDDSTAARLGLEAYLNEFLNNMFLNTEYLTTQFDVVTENLLEASSTMSKQSSVAFEYEVQKWLGALYSVGVSGSTIANISSAIGALGSGNISALSSNESMQNLIAMAATRSGNSLADLFTNGLDASKVNSLLEAMVGYLQEISSTDNLVVRSQYAELFGVTASDLVAVQNLSSVMKNISDNALSYSGALSNLEMQAGLVSGRLTAGEKINTLLDNFAYLSASEIATNPTLNAIWSITSMINSLTGGIPIPTIMAMGTGVDMNTTVENLIRGGIIGVSTLSGIGKVLAGMSGGLGIAGALNTLGVFDEASLNTVLSSRGLRSITSGGRRTTGGRTTSSYTYVGNTSGSDIYNQTMADAEAETDKKLADAQAESTEKTLTDIHEFLTNKLDIKLDTIIRIMSNMAGYSISPVSATTTSDIQGYNSQLVLGEAEVKLTASSDSMLEYTKNMSDTMNEIRDLLSSVITGGTVNAALATVSSLPFNSEGGNF